MLDLCIKAFAVVGLIFVIARIVGPVFWLFWRCEEYQIMVNKMWYAFKQEEYKNAREGKK